MLGVVLRIFTDVIPHGKSMGEALELILGVRNHVIS
jgi:hypothetical protein